MIELVHYVSQRTGMLGSFVKCLLTEEKTGSHDGYKNILHGILTIRMGCSISNGNVIGLSLNSSITNNAIALCN